MMSDDPRINMTEFALRDLLTFVDKAIELSNSPTNVVVGSRRNTELQYQADVVMRAIWDRLQMPAPEKVKEPVIEGQRSIYEAIDDNAQRRREAAANAI